MKSRLRLVASASLALALGLGHAAAEDWSRFRGPNGSGTVADGEYPAQLDPDKNLVWKTAARPGKSSPVLTERHVFLTEFDEGKLFTQCFLRQTGELVWERSEEQSREAHINGLNEPAANSPVTDGEHVYAYFGSRGLYCFDMEGNPQWDKDLGEMTVRMGFGEGSSPVLYDDKIVVNWDHEGQSFIIALDKKTGKEFWKVARDEGTSWATPLIVESNGQPQVITSASRHIRSYDLATGQLLWESSGMTANVIPSPVAANGMVYVMSGYRGNALQAIRLSAAKDNIAGSKALVWTLDRDTPYTPSPLLYDDRLYFLKRNDGILACFNANTGDEHFSRQRLKGIKGVYASPVGAGGRIYIASRNGTTQVIKHDTQYEVLAINTLDDSFSASPAVVDNELYLRGEKNLYCIAEK